MVTQVTTDFIEQQKRLYKSLRPCYCKAIQKTVHFTADGLNHLLYHKRRTRHIKERIYRAALISHIVEVITHANTARRETNRVPKGSILWILEEPVKTLYKGKKQVIKVILQEKGDGNVKFLSTMRKRF
jgi:hypothetical protein